MQEWGGEAGAWREGRTEQGRPGCVAGGSWGPGGLAGGLLARLPGSAFAPQARQLPAPSRVLLGEALLPWHVLSSGPRDEKGSWKPRHCWGSL